MVAPLIPTDTEACHLGDLMAARAAKSVEIHPRYVSSWSEGPDDIRELSRVGPDEGVTGTID